MHYIVCTRENYLSLTVNKPSEWTFFYIHLVSAGITLLNMTFEWDYFQHHVLYVFQNEWIEMLVNFQNKQTFNYPTFCCPISFTCYRLLFAFPIVFAHFPFFVDKNYYYKTLYQVLNGRTCNSFLIQQVDGTICFVCYSRVQVIFWEYFKYRQQFFVLRQWNWVEWWIFIGLINPNQSSDIWHMWNALIDCI